MFQPNRVDRSKGTISRDRLTFAKKIPFGPSVLIKISRQFGTMKNTPIMAFPFIKSTRYLGPNTIRGPSWLDLPFCRD